MASSPDIDFYEMVLTDAPVLATAPAEECKLLCTGKIIPPVDVEAAEPVKTKVIE